MSEYGYIPESPAQSFRNNKGIFTANDVYDLTNQDKWTNYGQLELIETKSFTGVSSIDFDNLGTGYNMHLFTFHNIHIDDNRDLFIRVKVGGSEQSGASDYGRALQGCADGYFYEDRDPDLHSIRVIPEIGNATGECITGYMYMYDALQDSKMTFFTQQLSAIKYDGKNLNNYGGTSYEITNAIDGVRFYPNAGNIAGTISIYAIKEY